MVSRIVRKLRYEVKRPQDIVTIVSRKVVPADPRARQMRTWVWGRIPRVNLAEVVPSVRGVDVTLLRALDREPGTSLHPDELVKLLVLVAGTGSRNVLEVGTFDGNTALNLAANIPDDGSVVTIDLPPDAIEGRIVGSQWHGTAYESKIRQILGDSAALDWSDFLHEPLDLAFIDGNHDAEHVRSDTKNAWRHVKPGGVIVWHDYSYFKDVSDVVDEIAERSDVYAIAGTRLAVCFTERTAPAG